jgi:hypothetical protein
MIVDGRATWLDEADSPRRRVIGASRDFIVDIEGVYETATYLGVEPEIINGSYHDVMLGAVAARTLDTLNYLE